VFCLGPGCGCGLDAGAVLASSEERDVSAHAAKATGRQVCLQKREPMDLFTSQAQDIVRVVGASPLCAVIDSAFVIMLEAISDGLDDRADLCSYILHLVPCKRAF
jgi:hypothetical protein